MKRTPIALPATYAEDAISRDLDIGEPTHWGKKQICFNATDAELNEMLSDAEYYASEYPYMDSYCKPIGLSAKRAVVKIKAAMS